MIEEVYPIYKFNAVWVQDCDPKKYEELPENWKIDLPINRFRNSTSGSKMFKEEPSQEELDKFIKDWWDKYSKSDKLKDLNVELETLNIEYKEHESWIIEWFGHKTFDVGLTDDEVLSSFERFVRRKEELGEDKYCLMGANDRWRWKGETEEHSPPCRCKHCKDQGVVRISH